MIKSDLVERVMKATDLPKPKASEAVNALFDGMKSALLRGDRIELGKSGIIVSLHGNSGIGRNPKTGLEVEIPPGKTIRFKPGKALRNMS